MLLALEGVLFPVLFRLLRSRCRIWSCSWWLNVDGGLSCYTGDCAVSLMLLRDAAA
jgi:hypothetical protein